MSNVAILEQGVRMDDDSYTHTVFVCDGHEYEAFGHQTVPLDILDFKNEFAARTYADAVNMGIAV